MNNELNKNSILPFGKYKGKQIREILEDDPTYVTEFLVKKLGKKIEGIEKVKKVSENTWGYKSGEGLYPDRLFYNEYLTVCVFPSNIIKDEVTGIQMEGRTLDEAKQLLNNELNEYYARECRIGIGI